MTHENTIDLERFEMVRGETFLHHVHDDHQLAWASSGVVMVDIKDRCWVLPPHLALWIPGGVRHATGALRESVLQGVYLDPVSCPLAWPRPTVLAVSPLARHLIGYLAGELAPEVRAHAEAVLLEVLRPADGAVFELPLPADPRARETAALLLDDPADPRGLGELAHAVGSSTRTLLRLFLAETGMTFTRWRTHARLQAALAHLAEGEPVGRVAERVGYATPSAFVAAFRRVTGTTPAAYFARSRGDADGPAT
ncbi:helix-turn-helix transcriptional regulator [Streptomyces sp. SID10815]|uniref:helix-turn-helix domain-containing protein n=1 Tax=Streptomyces sp. SID10815 TaxID=2706027 RepID=UPI0013C8628B|nr:helix-turn-helix transcriptional regulator [Streptomyces sp. SID10815]NEA52547.1 helix-turn-helix transcriptional regulator [Streptomyces sp. SID10815]